MRSVFPPVTAGMTSREDLEAFPEAMSLVDNSSCLDVEDQHGVVSGNK